MRRQPILPLLLVLPVACRPSPPVVREAPPLAVVVVVDQMRADYLERFGAQFTGGLARLLREGAVFGHAVHDHAVTLTAPGHATIATGTYPSRHGMVLNDWYERAEQRFVHAVGDEASPVLGSPEDDGVSPHRQLRGGLADWLKARSPRSAAYAVALKDRAAVLMAGRQPDGVYWYRYRDGAMVTSTYYRRDYPAWVTEFNRTSPAARYRNHPWLRLLPDSLYRVSREDAFPAEHDGRQIAFPHVVESGSGMDDDWFSRTGLPHTPFADEYVLGFVEELIVHEALGADTAPDILFIGASAGDFVGHWYGPLSQEIQDHYLRLDRYLAHLFDLLDTRVGRDRYIVALSSDHGVLPLPEELERRGLEAGRVTDSTLIRVAQRAAASAAAERGLGAPRVDTRWISVAMTFAEGTSEADMQAIRRAVAAALRTERAVADAFTYDELVAADPDPDRPFLALFRRSSHPDRLADVTIQLRENYLISSSGRGTSHGSPYAYDTQIPMVFAGPGIVAGTHDRPVRSIDLAPTVADLLGIPSPPDLDGTSLAPLITGSARRTP